MCYTGLLQVTMKANKTYRLKEALCVYIYIAAWVLSLLNRQTDGWMIKLSKHFNSPVAYNVTNSK